VTELARSPRHGVRSLFAGLFDDAALFPPGDAPMAAAVPAHRELRARLGELVGPFVVPAARLGELSEHLGDGSGDDGVPFGVSVIAAAGDLPAAEQAATSRALARRLEATGAAPADVARHWLRGARPPDGPRPTTLRRIRRARWPIRPPRRPRGFVRRPKL